MSWCLVHKKKYTKNHDDAVGVVVAVVVVVVVVATGWPLSKSGILPPAFQKWSSSLYDSGRGTFLAGLGPDETICGGAFNLNVPPRFRDRLAMIPFVGVLGTDCPYRLATPPPSMLWNVLARSSVRGPMERWSTGPAEWIVSIAAGRTTFVRIRMGIGGGGRAVEEEEDEVKPWVALDVRLDGSEGDAAII